MKLRSKGRMAYKVATENISALFSRERSEDSLSSQESCCLDFSSKFKKVSKRLVSGECEHVECELIDPSCVDESFKAFMLKVSTKLRGQQRCESVIVYFRKGIICSDVCATRDETEDRCRGEVERDSLVPFAILQTSQAHVFAGITGRYIVIAAKIMELAQISLSEC